MTEAGLDTPALFDLFVIGGGVNGCGIARDAAGRGLKVGLAERGDLAAATSSASTKLFHGGLRYLEYFELRLVREALVEREVLLRNMPHISRPMRFVLPYDPAMRFDRLSPASRLLGWTMPWTRGRRPAWMIRSGLFVYDHLGGRALLPGARSLDLAADPAGAALQPRFARAFEYSDCWVEDARLVALNARDAATRGARILTRTEVTAAARRADSWRLTLRDTETGALRHVETTVLVNAAGPWVGKVLDGVIGLESPARVRLVRGSHIVTRRLFDHDRAYFFQGADGRIVFAIPFETDFTLIGTTEAEHPDADVAPVCTPAERAYLLDHASRYFRAPVTEDQVVWSYSGVRPLYDDGTASATAATRDYVLKLDARGGAPVLSVFGGKITTYRRLAEAVLERIAPHLPGAAGRWTARAPLPGGDFPVGGAAALAQRLCRDHPFVDHPWAVRLVRAYGTEAAEILDGARRLDDLGRHFGHDLTEAEVRWMIEHEFARTAEDVLWRRSKLGLRLGPTQVRALAAWIDQARGTSP